MELLKGVTQEAQVNYSYDSFGRLDEVGDGTYTAQYARNVNNQLTDISIADTAQPRTYDSLGRLTSIGAHSYVGGA